MKTARLHVRKSISRWYIRESDSTDLQMECQEEIKRLKEKKIGGSNVCFYEILKEDFNKLAVYAKNESILKTLEDNKEWKKDFPIYGNMMQTYFKKGIKRQPLLELCIKFLDFAFTARLPDNCAENIFWAI